MSIENNFKTFRQQTYKYNTNNNSKKGSDYVMSYEEGYKFIIEQDILKAKLTEDIDERFEDKSKSKTVIKDKEYFRDIKSVYTEKINEIVAKNNMHIREFPDTIAFVHEVVEDIIGYSSIKKLMYDASVTDIYCLKWDKIYYESDKFSTPQKFQGSFKDEKAYKDFIERLLRESGKGMLDNGENKIIDFDLYGDRFNAISKAVSPNDYCLTIRKHKEEHITLEEIISNKCMSQEVADLLGMLILGECNIIISGITGSGKTTTMRALLDYYVSKANKRMLVCEDTRELFPKNDHTLELVTSKGSNEKNSITLRDLIILALRQKPKYIVVGEVRGPEAESAVEAMETGHSTLFSMHSGTPIDAINRLITKYLMQIPNLGVDVVERIIGSAVDYIVIQDDIPNIGRRITSLTEVSYNYESKRVALKTIIKYNFHTNKFDKVSNLSIEKAEKMLRKGITIKELSEYVDWK